MFDFKELIKKMKQTKSKEEMIEMAKENGVELQGKEAEALFEKLNQSNEMTDDDLEDIAGGWYFLLSLEESDEGDVENKYMNNVF